MACAMLAAGLFHVKQSTNVTWFGQASQSQARGTLPRAVLAV
jgi:hypothetical protein